MTIEDISSPEPQAFMLSQPDFVSPSNEASEHKFEKQNTQGKNMAHRKANSIAIQTDNIPL